MFRDYLDRQTAVIRTIFVMWQVPALPASLLRHFPTSAHHRFASATILPVDGMRNISYKSQPHSFVFTAPISMRRSCAQRRSNSGTAHESLTWLSAVPAFAKMSKHFFFPPSFPSDTFSITHRLTLPISATLKFCNLPRPRRDRDPDQFQPQ